MGALVALAAFTALVGTAHAGYVHMGSDGAAAYFTAGPLETPDLRFQVLHGGATIVFEDRAHPITPGVPLVNEASEAEDAHLSTDTPCRIVSAHKARCTTTTERFFWQTFIDTGNRAARVRDRPGNEELAFFISSGPLADDIEVNHQASVRVHDQGGPNRIRLGTTCAFCWFSDSSVKVGPGASTIDVRNATLDYVYCGSIGTPRLSTGGSAGPLDTVLVDELDEVSGCDNVERG